MIFSQYNYQEFHNGNKELWPIQPATWENWCKMVKGSYDYCKKLKVDFIDEFVGKCNYWQLPSEHPYWAREIYKSNIGTLETLRRKYQECIENPEMLKYHFSINTSLETVKKMVETKEKEIQRFLHL